MSKVRLSDALEVTNGRPSAGLPEEFSISTDTRTIAPGEIYLALSGERFDGHDFVPQAASRGAAGAIVSRALDTALPALLVPDTKAAYLALAGTVRRRFGGRIVAITGSTGKTTTKAFLEQMLNAYAPGRVIATPANENNEIGVARLLLQTESDHAFAIVEMGARHPHDILALVEAARPDAGVLTNIGEAHLEIMGSREALVDTKWELFACGAQPVLCARDADSRARAAALTMVPDWFGLDGDEIPHPCRRAVLVADHGVTVRDGAERRVFRASVKVPGLHNAMNAAAAITAALALDVPMAAIAPTLPALRLPPGRYESVQLSNGARVVFDGYNASPSGMIATLSAFAGENARRRIAVLASMAELGNGAAEMHELIGAKAAAVDLSLLLVGGEFAAQIARGAVGAGFPAERIGSYDTNADALARLKQEVRAGDVVLLKGSRKYRLEEILEGLRA